MKQIFFIMFFVVAIATWCQPGFAVETDNGAGPFTMSTTGQTQGVALTGQGWRINLEHWAGCLY